MNVSLKTLLVTAGVVYLLYLLWNGGRAGQPGFVQSPGGGGIIPS